MNKFSIAILKGSRKIHQLINPDAHASLRNWKMFSNKKYSNDLIAQFILSDEPCMISRFGSTEMLCITNYLGVKKKNKNWLNYIQGKSLPWWWESGTINQLQKWSGVFPPTLEMAERFSELLLNDMKHVDLLGSWLNQENLFIDNLTATKRVMLEDLEPFFTENSWTKALKGKKVLVIHPFAETIQSQYEKRSLIFPDGLLPDFKIITIKAVQSVAGEQTAFKTWFDALDYMKNQMDSIDYDVSIIGCGAYGLPLAAHAKRKGKKGIHLAGITQLLFGIKGKRWEQFIVWPYMNLFNEHWVRPGENEKPKNAHIVENACYW